MLKIIVVQMDKEIILQTYEEVEKTFDEAFNEAVQTSKETILLDSSFYSLIKRKNEILKALNTAITNDSLEVYLQPLIDSSTKRIIAAEALVRIKDKELGLIPPSEFISMAEENGYIETLGEQVLNKVCNFLENIEGTKYHLQWINVNLSPIQCLDSNLLKIVNEIVDRHHISHDLIHLEITEECIIDIDLLRSQMEKLITSGYKISLDDFGSGFSNLSMIKVLPFSNVKLDMSIVKGHFTHPDEMLPGIVDTFTKKGLSVTAEGVETKEMSEELTCIGCTYLQGFCFSRPIPMKDFVDLLEKE